MWPKFGLNGGWNWSPAAGDLATVGGGHRTAITGDREREERHRERRERREKG